MREAPHVADRVAWSLGVVAVFLLRTTLLGLVAITLCSGEPVGLTLGLLSLASWTLQTDVVGLWTEFGPAAAGRFGDGFGALGAVRVVLGVVLFVHLRRIGGRYVEAEAAADGGTGAT